MSRLSMLVAGLCLTAVAGSDVNAREPAPVVVKEIVRTMKNDVGQAITVPSGHLQLVVSTYDIAPGARLPAQASVRALCVVIQGDLMVEQVGSSSRVYHAGEFVVESVNRWHFGQAIGEVPVKLLVIDQLPPGRKATVLRSRTHCEPHWGPPPSPSSRAWWSRRIDVLSMFHVSNVSVAAPAVGVIPQRAALRRSRRRQLLEPSAI